jgi:hypothetical protein
MTQVSGVSSGLRVRDNVTIGYKSSYSYKGCGAYARVIAVFVSMTL